MIESIVNTYLTSVMSLECFQDNVIVAKRNQTERALNGERPNLGWGGKLVGLGKVGLGLVR